MRFVEAVRVFGGGGVDDGGCRECRGEVRVGVWCGCCGGCPGGDGCPGGGGGGDGDTEECVEGLVGLRWW